MRRLFEKRRTGGWIWTGIGGAFALRIISVAATSNSDAASGTPAGTAVGVAVLGGIPAAIGVGKLVRFSAERELETVAAYEKTRKLPNYIQRRLRQKYFSS
ncbi:hypothetical protein [Hymenobacter sp. B1770]|uniref:hypothetical protein n=1 Tax=Hymenobacter sp. B1770 TaxID=1718788 RepID=UPI003CE7BFCF